MHGPDRHPDQTVREGGILMNVLVRIFSIYLFLGVLQAGFLAAYAVTKGNTRVNRIFATLCGLIAIFLFGYLLELNSTTLEQMIF